MRLHAQKVYALIGLHMHKLEVERLAIIACLLSETKLLNKRPDLSNLAAVEHTHQRGKPILAALALRVSLVMQQTVRKQHIPAALQVGFGRRLHVIAHQHRHIKREIRWRSAKRICLYG